VPLGCSLGSFQRPIAQRNNFMGVAGSEGASKELDDGIQGYFYSDSLLEEVCKREGNSTGLVNDASVEWDGDFAPRSLLPIERTL